MPWASVAPKGSDSAPLRFSKAREIENPSGRTALTGEKASCSLFNSLFLNLVLYSLEECLNRLLYILRFYSH